MYFHVMVGSNDLERATSFYDAVMAAIGHGAGRQDAKGRIVYTDHGVHFMISMPIDGHDARPANGGTIAFKVASAEHVNAWHRAGLANGGQVVEDPPGLRSDSGLYLAYLRDPDGNKLCAVFKPEEV